MKKALMLAVTFFAVFFIFNPVSAHPGNTASDGCHYCRTNCDSWGVAWNVRHCHGGSTAPTITPTYVAPKPVYVPTKTTTYDYKYEDVPFLTKYEDDANLEVGKEQVKQVGALGKKTITFKISKTDGVETGRVQTKEEITAQPIDQIIARGTKQPQASVPIEKNDQEVKGQVAENQINDPVATLVGFLVVVGIPTGIIWMVVKKLKRKS